MVIPSETEVVVVGGGPAGLAAAIAARLNGFDVCVVERAQPPIDKACGEGLLPDGIAALRRLGVVLGTEHGTPFHGIRFVDDRHSAEALLPLSHGIGIRRTALHKILQDRAEVVGVLACWEMKVTGIEPDGVRIGNHFLRCRWIIGADGSRSQIRQWAGLSPGGDDRRRIGLRQHFHVKPWSDFVEVYWAKGCQAYVTPVGPDEVCVALLDRSHELRFSDLALRFPRLDSHLKNAEPIGSVCGGSSASIRLSRVTQGRIALVGDASGSVDAITGEGLALAFRQAAALGAALAEGDLSIYEAMHRRICRMPFLMAQLLLLMDDRESLREIVFQALANRPRIFGRLLATHVGALHPAAASLDVLALAFGMLVGATTAHAAVR